jgi:anti-sigma factor RsiW
MNCEQVEEQLARYVDGEPVDQPALIAAHIQTCESCRSSAHAQSVARSVLRARATELAPMAPPGLRTRVIANLPQDLKTPRPQDLKTSRPQDLKTSRPQDLSWSGRLTAFATAAMVVLTLGAVLLPVTNIRSTAVLAAQLALDHLKCFTIEGDADGEPIPREQAEAVLRQEYGFTVKVPASLPAERLELLGVRRCLYGDGRAAHLMYRLNGEPVSLFIIPGLQRPAAELSLFGHDQVVWTEGDRTYMLVARGGLQQGLSRVASHLRNEAQ